MGKITIKHRDGCPKARTEEYTRTTPKGAEVTSGRCIDCGAREVGTKKDTSKDGAA